MKIAIISNDSKRAASIRQVFEADGIHHGIMLVGGGLERLGPALDKVPADAVILDEICITESDLAELGKLSQHYPQSAFIMLCPEVPTELLLHAMRIGVRDVLTSPVSAEDLRAAVARVEQKSANGAKRPKGKVLAFLACKGGSGATFLACNLGYVLAAEYGKKVALIDLNLQFGDASLFVSDKIAATNLSDLANNIARLDASFLTSSMVQVLPNFGVLAAPENPAQGADVRPEHVETLLRLAMTEYDYVILDVERNLDAVSIKALDHADMVFPVLQETLPFIRDAKRIISTLQSLGYSRDKIHLIVNRYEKEGDIQLSDVERTLDMKVFAIFPNSFESVSASVNQGVPILKLSKKDAVSKALVKLGQDLEQSEKEKGGWLGNLFGRG